MIRDAYRIFGEPNDPNTVLAEGNLEINKLVVGADNHNIKTLDLPKNSIIIGDGNGVSTFTCDVPNKYIVTDEEGNLKFTDTAIGKNIFKIGSTENRIVSISASSNLVSEISNFDNCSVVYVTKSNEELNSVTIRFNLENSLYLSKDTEVYINIQVSMSNDGLINLKFGDKLLIDKTNIDKQFNIKCAICFNKKITMKEGTYDTLEITTESLLGMFTEEAITISGLILF